MNDTINGKDPRDVSKVEALKYCYDHSDTYARMFDNVADGLEQFANLIVLIESDTIGIDELPDYGMCDQKIKK